MAELVYATDLKSVARKSLRVRVPPAAPEWNSEVLKKQKCGTREARPNGFRLNFALNPQGNPPKMNPNSARKRAEFFRRGVGAKSEAILTNFALPEIQKEFLLL